MILLQYNYRGTDFLYIHNDAHAQCQHWQSFQLHYQDLPELTYIDVVL